MTSRTYRLMIYFAHSTMVMYGAKSLANQTPEQFYTMNGDIMKRVFQEGLNIMEYELSHNQIMSACSVFLMSKYKPQDVTDTEAYELKQTK